MYFSALCWLYPHSCCRARIGSPWIGRALVDAGEKRQRNADHDAPRRVRQAAETWGSSSVRRNTGSRARSCELVVAPAPIGSEKLGVISEWLSGLVRFGAWEHCV